jgi:hypothetical protein
MNMNRPVMAAKALALILSTVSSTNAAPFSYICAIEAFHGHMDDEERVNFLGNLAMKTTVAIDRRTGALIHPVVGNTSYRTTTVLADGDESSAFKLLSESGTAPDELSGGNIIYAEVEEYAKGARKPFLLIDSGIAYFGYCE